MMKRKSKAWIGWFPVIFFTLLCPLSGQAQRQSSEENKRGLSNATMREMF